MVSFQIIASVFIVWLTVFSTSGYASSYDEVHTQTQVHAHLDDLTATAAVAKSPASKPFPGIPFPEIPDKPPKYKLDGEGGGGDATKPAPLTARTESLAVGTGEVENSEKNVNYKCWSTLRKTNNCVRQIFSAYSRKKYKLISSKCCSSIQKISEDCYARTIGSFHDHFFVDSVNPHCSAAA